MRLNSYGIACASAILLYAFAILCGAFSYIFVEFPSLEVLARNSIVGLCAVALPSASVISLAFWMITKDTALSMDVCIAVLVVLASASYGFGGLIFHTPETELSISACLLGGLIFSMLGFLLYSTLSTCVRSRYVQDEESCASNYSYTDDVEHEVTSTYRIVQHPCENHIQIAVTT